jgi:nitrogen fixation/metabolism regulation signal transduction histidine kinase
MSNIIAPIDRKFLERFSLIVLLVLVIVYIVLTVHMNNSLPKLVDVTATDGVRATYNHHNVVYSNSKEMLRQQYLAKLMIKCH